jgi:hypothetical protein
MRQAYSDDEGIPADVEEERLREAEGQVSEEMEIETQHDRRHEAQRAALDLFPNAPTLHARINGAAR